MNIWDDQQHHSESRHWARSCRASGKVSMNARASRMVRNVAPSFVGIGRMTFLERYATGRNMAEIDRGAGRGLSDAGPYVFRLRKRPPTASILPILWQSGLSRAIAADLQRRRRGISRTCRQLFGLLCTRLLSSSRGERFDSDGSADAEPGKHCYHRNAP
jgi:hypothetical protein